MQSLADDIRSQTCPGCGSRAHVLVISDPDVTAWCVVCIEAEVRYIEDLDGDSTAFVESFFVFTVQVAGVLYLGRTVSFHDPRFVGYLRELVREFDLMPIDIA